MCSEDYLRAFERKIVRHCAPTLSGIKPANIFTCCDEHAMYRPDELAALGRSDRRHNIVDALEDCDDRLAPSGVHVRILAFCGNGPLILAYRPAEIAQVLADFEVAAFLRARGYEVNSVSKCIARLGHRLAKHAGRGEFPHEIGVFLGYPLADVLGFIANGGKGYRLLGYWKVYGDSSRARRMFASYEQCTRTYEELFESGVPIEQLTSFATTATPCLS